MQSLRFSFVTGCCVLFLFLVYDVAVADSLGWDSGKRAPCSHSIQYIHAPHFCQSFLLVATVDGVSWAISYDAAHQSFSAKWIYFLDDLPSSVLWVIIDHFDDNGSALATIRPYDNQSLALTVDHEMLFLQKERKNAHNQAWNIMLAPSATFFKLGSNVFSLNHQYMNFAINSNGGVLHMGHFLLEDSDVLKTIDPITGQSCTAYLNDRYNHLMY